LADELEEHVAKSQHVAAAELPRNGSGLEKESELAAALARVAELEKSKSAWQQEGSVFHF
jgi:hypothetical protein